MNSQDLVESARKILVSWGGISRLKDEDGGYWQVQFPSSSDSEYSFEACLYMDGEVQIRARTNGGKPDEYFWYVSYEKPDFPSLLNMHQRFKDLLLLLLSHDSRVTHHGGLLFRSFECEYFAGGSWLSVGGNGYFRWGGFETPSEPCGSVWHAAAVEHLKHNHGFNRTPESSGPAKPGKLSGGAG
jgi:hypothetical protein